MFLAFGKFQIRIKYDGQPTTCRCCNAPDHLFKDLKNKVCFNCDRIGPHSRMCTEDMCCCICKEEGHLAIDCQHSWYRQPPPSLDLSRETVAEDPVESVPAPTPVEPSSQVAVTKDTCDPSQADLTDSESQPGCSEASVRVLDSQGDLIGEDPAVANTPALSSPPGSVPLFSGDHPSPTSASAVSAPSLSDDTFVPSVSDSALGWMPSAPEDPMPSVTDSTLAEVVMPPASEDPAPSVTNSTLAKVEMPPASVDLTPSVPDSALAQVLSPSDVPALDLPPPPRWEW